MAQQHSQDQVAWFALIISQHTIHSYFCNPRSRANVDARSLLSTGIPRKGLGGLTLFVIWTIKFGFVRLIKKNKKEQEE